MQLRGRFSPLKRREFLEQVAKVVSGIDVGEMSKQELMLAARVAKALGEGERGIELLKAAVEIDSDDPELRDLLGETLVELGEIEAGVKEFQAALAIRPGHARAWLHLRRASKSAQPTDEVAELERFLHLAQHDRDRDELLFTMGRIWESAGEPERAFKVYERANVLLSTRIPESRRRKRWWLEREARLRRIFSREFVEGNQSAAVRGPGLVLIVGMPRSGTTLLEHLLTGHPEIFGAGELRDLDWYARRFGRRVEHDRSEMGQMIRNSAVEEAERLNSLKGNATLIIDKMPLNFWHVGWAKLMFEEVKVLECVRDPLDVGLSCLKQKLAWPLCDQQGLGSFMGSQRRMMDHWRELFPESIQRVEYEHLVRDPESVMRGILEFLGLDWHAGCLEGPGAPRSVQTPSKVQVRQAIYQTSVGAWKKFDRHLGPLKQSLAESAQAMPAVPGPKHQ